MSYLNPLAVKAFGIFATAISICACGASEDQTLAATAQTHVLIVSSRLEDFAATRNELAEHEKAQLVIWTRSIADTEAHLKKQEEALKEAGDAGTFKKVADIKAFAERIAGVEATSEADAAIVDKAISDSLQELQTPIDEMKLVGKGLGELAKEESFKKRVKFLVSFAKQVNKEIEKAKEEQEKAATDAKSTDVTAKSAATKTD